MNLPSNTPPYNAPQYSGQQNAQQNGQQNGQRYPAYNAQQYGGQPAYAPQQEDPKANVVMVLGILGIFFGICAFIGWIIGAMAKKDAEAEGRPIDSKLKTWTTVSKVFSIIYIAVFVLFVLFVVVLGGILASY